MKTQTVLRLELCAAVLLSKLLHRTMDEYVVRVSEVFAWSDSSVTLSWLRAEPSTRWPVFVAHRVAQVQQHLPRITWRYVPSEDIPADLATLGVDPAQLSDKVIWWVKIFYSKIFTVQSFLKKAKSIFRHFQGS